MGVVCSWRLRDAVGVGGVGLWGSSDMATSGVLDRETVSDMS